MQRISQPTVHFICMNLYSIIDTSHLNTADSFQDPCIVPWENKEQENKKQQQQKILQF